MLSIAKVRGPLIMGIFPLQKYLPHIKSDNEPASSGIERVKKIFVTSELQPVSNELRTLMSFTGTAGIIGALAGGTIHTQSTVQNFIDNNMATRFYSHHDAQKQVHYSFAVQFFKGAYKFGWRAALFTTIFGFIQMVLAAYYGKPSIWHYALGGGTAGFLFKLSLGLRGSLVGLIVGSIFGGIGGSLSLLLFKATGLTMEDLQNARQEWADSQNKKYKELVEQNMEEQYKEAKLLYDENKSLREQLSLEEEKVAKSKT